MTMQVENGWKGFKAEYVNGKQINGNNNWQQQKEINDSATLRALGLSRSQTSFIDMIEGEA